MKTITICSSMRNLDAIRTTIKSLELLGIRGLFPNIDFQPEGEQLSMKEMKMLQAAHFNAITPSDAVYVINPGGYIGTMVTAEIGFASGKNIAVYFSEASGKIELDALSSGVISLDSLEEFKVL